MSDGAAVTPHAPAAPLGRPDPPERVREAVRFGRAILPEVSRTFAIDRKSVV